MPDHGNEALLKAIRFVFTTYIFNDEQTLRAGLELVGVAPLATFSKLWFLAETSVTRLGLAQAIQLFDYNLNRFVELNGTVASAEDQLSLIAVLTNPMRFKGPGNQVKARLLWGPINDEDPAQDGWLHDIDLARWEASP